MPKMVVIVAFSVVVSGCGSTRLTTTVVTPVAQPVPALAPTSARAEPTSVHISSTAPAAPSSAPAHDAAALVPPGPADPDAAAQLYVIQPNDPNPRAQSILEAHRTGAFPERLTPLIAPKPFNPVAWKRNPAAYLNVVEPGRIDQTSSDPAAPPICPTTPPRIIPAQSGSLTVLHVRAVPYAPVSWVTTSGGVFTESKVGAVTVQADADGIATVTYFASPGVEGYTQILAASPCCGSRAEQTIAITADSLPAASPHGGEK